MMSFAGALRTRYTAIIRFETQSNRVPSGETTRKAFAMEGKKGHQPRIGKLSPGVCGGGKQCLAHYRTEMQAEFSKAMGGAAHSATTASTVCGIRRS